MVEALRELGNKEVNAYIVDVSELNALIYGIKLNIKRQAHDPVGLGQSFKFLHHKYDLRYKDIAGRFNFTKDLRKKLLYQIELCF